MEKLFELTFQDQTLNPRVGAFTDASQTTGTFTLEDGEYYLTNAGTKGFYAYSPVAIQSGLVDDSKVIIEFDLKVVTASVNTHAIIGTYAGVDGDGIPTGAKITLQYNAGDIELVLGSGTTETLIAAADVVVDQWYHFRIDCALTAAIESTYEVKIDGAAVTTVTGATTDYELGIISVLGTDLHACDECGIKNITFVTETNLYVGRTALDQALQDVKGYVDNQVGACVPKSGGNIMTGSLGPSTSGGAGLGDSTHKWSTINGIAPDELGLPTSTYTDVTSYITNFDGTANTFTAPVSGLLFFEEVSGNYISCTIGNNTKGYLMNIPHVSNSVRGLFPIEKGDSISVYVDQLPLTITAKIFHLKGKV